MSKIIKITDEFVLIADADKSVHKVPLSAFDFEPKLNQQIEVYQLDGEYIVNEVDDIKITKETTKFSDSTNESIKDKIHINIINENKPQNINTNTNTSTQNNSHYGYPEQGTVGKWAFICVSLFLGGLGGNFFMLRKPLLGILCILFVWTYIPAFIGLFHAVVAIFKRPDSYGRIRM